MLMTQVSDSTTAQKQMIYDAGHLIRPLAGIVADYAAYTLADKTAGLFAEHDSMVLVAVGRTSISPRAIAVVFADSLLAHKILGWPIFSPETGDTRKADTDYMLSLAISNPVKLGTWYPPWSIMLFDLVAELEAGTLARRFGVSLTQSDPPVATLFAEIEAWPCRQVADTRKK